MQEFRDLNTLKSILVSSGLAAGRQELRCGEPRDLVRPSQGGRVLLIDGDMRRATLHKLLGCAAGPGLTEYLVGRRVDSSMSCSARAPSDPANPAPAGLASLTFIPAGNEHDKAADLSGNHRFEQLDRRCLPRTSTGSSWTPRR